MPWITDEARSILNKKNIEYRKNGRSEEYYRLRNKAREVIARDKKCYYDRECNRMSQKDSHRVSFNALKISAVLVVLNTGL